MVELAQTAVHNEHKRAVTQQSFTNFLAGGVLQLNYFYLQLRVPGCIGSYMLHELHEFERHQFAYFDPFWRNNLKRIGFLKMQNLQ